MLRYSSRKEKGKQVSMNAKYEVKATPIAGRKKPRVQAYTTSQKFGKLKKPKQDKS